MDYGRIVNKSFEIAWKYKSLWIFGMFAGYGTFNFNLDIPTYEFEQMPATPWEMVNVPPQLLIMFVLALAALALIFFVISVISKGAIIDSVNRIERGGRYSFGNAFSAGIDFFLRMLGLIILGGLSTMAVVIVVVGAVVIAFVIHTAFGVIFLLIGIPALILLFFAVVSIFGLSERALVVRNSGIGAALEEGYYLFRKHIREVAVIALIVLAFTIGLSILAAIIWMIFALPIAAIGFMGSMDVVTAMVMGVIVGLPISFVVGGFLGVFFTSLITLFYFELVEPKNVPAAQPPPAAAPLA